MGAWRGASVPGTGLARKRRREKGRATRARGAGWPGQPRTRTAKAPRRDRTWPRRRVASGAWEAGGRRTRETLQRGGRRPGGDGVSPRAERVRGARGRSRHPRKRCRRVSRPRGGGRGQRGPSAMAEPRPGRTACVSAVSLRPGEYERPSRKHRAAPVPAPSTNVPGVAATRPAPELPKRTRPRTASPAAESHAATRAHGRRRIGPPTPTTDLCSRSRSPASSAGPAPSPAASVGRVPVTAPGSRSLSSWPREDGCGRVTGAGGRKRFP